MKNKSFVNMLEMITVVIVLYVAFSVFFPGFSYKTKWSEALLLQTARDVITTADRIEKLYDYSFSPSAFQNFLSEAVSRESIISWSETEGTVKNQIVIACNCTNGQMVNLTSWLLGLNVNGRQINAVQCYTNLEFINPCMVSSDVLLIWGEKNFSRPVYSITLQEYLKGEGGVVEVADFTKQLDSVQANIFGLKDGGEWDSPTYDVVLKPATVDNVTYQAYKIYLKGLKGDSNITEFCKDQDPSKKKIIPSDEDKSRVLVQVDSDVGAAFSVSCAVFNTTRIAWMADFTDGSFDANHTKLLTSLLLAASNKRVAEVLIPSIRTGYMTSYINVKNADMFEVYRFNLGLGYPY